MIKVPLNSQCLLLKGMIIHLAWLFRSGHENKRQFLITATFWYVAAVWLVNSRVVFVLSDWWMIYRNLLNWIGSGGHHAETDGNLDAVKSPTVQLWIVFSSSLHQVAIETQLTGELTDTFSHFNRMDHVKPVIGKKLAEGKKNRKVTGNDRSYSPV